MDSIKATTLNESTPQRPSAESVPPPQYHINVTQHQPFLKGKLTMASALLLAFLEGPNVVEKIVDWYGVFVKAADAPPSLITIVAFAGMIYGIIRRNKGYFQKNNLPPVREPNNLPSE